MRVKRKGPLLIAVTMGDPAGIGAEVIVKAAGARRERRGAPSMVVIGDLGVMRETSRRLRSRCAVRRWQPGEPIATLSEALPVLAASELSATARHPGRPSVAGAHAAYDYIMRGAQMAMRGEVDALVTGPISKEWMNRAGHRYPGQTEVLAGLAKVRLFRMMFAGDALKLALVTVHIALADVPAAINVKNVLDTIRLLARHLRECHGLARPRIGVLGLNPHAGEHGLFGDEERRAIAPAVRRAGREGIDAFGPLAPDSAFLRTQGGFRFDAAVAMYHDQGLIALKTLEFDRAVNVTLGLPFIRTSPDHGTAFEIAGSAAARPSSMIAALEYAGRAAMMRATAERHAA